MEHVNMLKGATIIDGNGGPPLQDGVLVIRGDRIEAIGSASEVEVPEGAAVEDVSGKTVLPGLIDAHVHFLGLRSADQVSWVIDHPHVRGMRSVMDAWRMISYGFTTVRDLAGLLPLYLKTAIEEGSVIGPRIMASGLAVSQTGGHGDTHFVPLEWTGRVMMGRMADGVAEVRKAAREQLREGADCLKIMTTGGVMSERDTPEACHYSLDEIQAFVEEARNVGVKTAAHAQGTKGIRNALVGGVDSIQHGIFLDDECISLMLEKEATLVPTFAIVEAIVTKGRDFGVREVSVKKAESVMEVHLESFKKAYRAGVKCGLGSDYLSDPMSPLGEGGGAELSIYVRKAGLSPMEAIVCATRNNAEVIGREADLGTLEKGKLADLVVVNGDPLESIDVLRDRESIECVYKGGTMVPDTPF